METFDIGRKPYWELTHYGCNVAVTLLLPPTLTLTLTLHPYPYL